MPTASELPDIDLLVSEQVPATTNELGVRGAGEGGLTGAGAAIASAVSDALGLPAMTALPLSPARVLAALAEPAQVDEHHSEADQSHPTTSTIGSVEWAQ